MSVNYRHMHGDDPVRFGFDIDGKLTVIEVTREAIDDCLPVRANESYKEILNQNKIRVSSALASWLATDKPTKLNVDRRMLTMIMDKYNAH